MRGDPGGGAGPDGGAFGIDGDAVGGAIPPDQGLVGGGDMVVDVLGGGGDDGAILATLHDQEGGADGGQADADLVHQTQNMLAGNRGVAAVVPEAGGGGGIDVV